MIEKGKDVSFLVSNRAGKKGESPECFDGMVRERNRRGRIRDLRQSLPASGLRQMSGEIGDREVEPAINAWDLLVTRLKARERNRRASASLSPVLSHFLAPHGKLYQRLLTLEQVLGSIPPPITVQEHPGPHEHQHGSPSEEWPQVVHRVREHHEPLRQVAADYGVSHETIRRVLRTSRNHRAG